MNTFLTAIMFFTRLPVPARLPYSKELLNNALRFFPLTGAVVGIIGAGILWLALLIFPASLAVLVSMISTIIVTGAFHEDGFADFCDGYGGGHSKEKILVIMKDSRLGTYGTIGLIAMLSAKFITLNAIHIPEIFTILITAHIFSRSLPVLLVFTTSYIRDDSTSKSKSVGNSISVKSLVIALLTVIVPLFFLNLVFVSLVIAISALLFYLFRIYIIKRTGGYSGDTLGALQQLSEIVFYMVFIAVNNDVLPL